MDQKAITCCFTGHRMSKLPWGANEQDSRCVELMEKLYAVTEAVYVSGCTRFICGMANGCDLYFADTVMRLRAMHPEIHLEAAVPFRGQADSWPTELKLKYRRYLELCDEVTILRERYTPDCMMNRNRYMVDHASVLIACYDGTPGGTMNTLLYAMRQGIETIQIPLE